MLWFGACAGGNSENGAGNTFPALYKECNLVRVMNLIRFGDNTQYKLGLREKLLTYQKSAEKSIKKTIFISQKLIPDDQKRWEVMDWLYEALTSFSTLTKYSVKIFYSILLVLHIKGWSEWVHVLG